MAWPVSGNYEARVANVTTVKKAWADATDAAFNGLYGGTKTVKALTVDATGYQASATAAGQLVVSGATGNVNAVVGSGSGTGYGGVFAGGATGAGVYGAGGGTSGSGAVFLAGGGNSDGVVASGAGTGAAFHATASPIQIDTARSSATGGAGQSVAAGAIYKDTAVFAWGKITVNPAGPTITIVRSANVASVTRNGVGQYTVTLQTAATNVLIPIVTPLISAGGAICMTVDSPDGTGPTTTAFRVLCFDAAGAAADVPGTGNEGFFFACWQG